MIALHALTQVALVVVLSFVLVAVASFGALVVAPVLADVRRWLDRRRPPLTPDYCRTYDAQLRRGHVRSMRARLTPESPDAAPCGPVAGATPGNAADGPRTNTGERSARNEDA